MIFSKHLFILTAAAALFAAANAAPQQGNSASKTGANYRQSNARRQTTITNPYAITAKKIKEDPAATAEFKKLQAQYWKMVKAKEFDAIHSAIDDFLEKNKKLTPDQKSMVYYCKANTYLLAKDYESAIKTGQQGVRIGGLGAGRNAATVIKAAMAEKNTKLIDKTIADFEKSKNFPDADYYSAVVNHCFNQKRPDDAFNYLKAFGKQPLLSAGNRAQILKGFGRYYMMKKRFKEAIAQYNAVKDIPKIDPYTSGDAELQMAACYLQMNNKEKALEIYQSLTKSKHAGVRASAQREIKKLTAKPAPAKKAPAKKKAAAKKKN